MPRNHRFRRLFRLPSRSPDRIARDVDDELEFHLAMREEEFRAQGLNESEARMAATRRFGDVENARDYCRVIDGNAESATRRRDRLTGVWQDLSFAVRQLRRAPGFTAAAVVTLALGIGANVAIFSVVYRLMLAPLPFPDADRLVSLVRTMHDRQVTVSPGPEDLVAMRAGAQTLEWLAPFDDSDVTIGGTADPRIVHAVRIDPSLPAKLGNAPILGRSFAPEETVPNGPRVAILGYSLWQGRFGGQSDVLGQTIHVDGVPYTIVGVLPRDFDLISNGDWVGGDLWLPLPEQGNQRGFSVLAKMRPGVTLAQATAEAERILDAQQETKMFGTKLSAQLIPARAELSDGTRRMLLLLFGAVGVVLLIACANVASLLLARASGRSREIAVRMALGAGRGRLVRQLLTESALLALLGGTAGVAVAYYGLQAIIAMRSEPISALASVRLEPVVLAWSLAVSALTGLLFGLAPALVGARESVSDALRGARAASGGGRTRAFRATLVTGEVALSVVLLIAAGLLIRTVVELRHKDLGFSPDGLVSARIVLPDNASSSPEARKAAYAALRQAVADLPGIQDATLASSVPPSTGILFGKLQAEGSPGLGEESQMIPFNAVQPDYFREMGISLLDGTTFDSAASNRSDGVLISTSIAEALWPNERAVGRRLRIVNPDAAPDRSPQWSTVLGVVEDVRSPGSGDGFFGERQLYVPFDPVARRAQLIVRSAPGAGNVFSLVVRAAAGVSGSIQVREYASLESKLADEIAQERFTMALLAAFAAIAAGLAAVGLYGVVAYSVAQRRREIGIRLAVGAGTGRVQRMVLAEGMRLTIVGVVLGLLGAWGAGRLIRGMLYGVGVTDSATYILVVLGVMVVAAGASWVPAVRAGRVEVVEALRGE